MLITVVCGIIWNEGKVLLAQRPLDKDQGGLWEFPGGKVEPGESLIAALKREIDEELNLKIEVGDPLKPNDFRPAGEAGDKIIRLCGFHAFSREPQKLQLREHLQVVWSRPSEFKDFKFAPADLPIVQEILETKA